MKHKLIALVAALLMLFQVVMPVMAIERSANGSTVTLAADSYMWPTPGTNISQNYSSSHTALDITGGGTIVATKPGTVYYVYTGCINNNAASTKVPCTSTGCTPNAGTYVNSAYNVRVCNWGYGNGVVIQHSDGSGYSMYAHMKNVLVSKGQAVHQGEALGEMGSTGCSTGTHLHFELSSGMSMSGTYCKPSGPINSNPSSISYIAYNCISGESPNPTPQVNWSDYSGNPTTIWEQNALLSQTVTWNSAVGGAQSASDCGVFLFDYNGNLLTAKTEQAFQSADYTVNMWYNLYEELGYTLTKGTVYKYQFLLALSGPYAEYYSPMYEFVTSGNYTIYFNANGGSCSSSSVSAICGRSVGNLPTPTRDGYTFLGWFDAADGGNYYDANTVFPCTWDITLYAHWAAENAENLKYEVSDGEVTITGYVTEPTGELIIPETIEGYPVTTIGEKAFYDCDSLTHVEMPHVQTVGDYAFYGCGSLASVEMPSVQTIDGQAFSNCSSLTSVEMPHVQTIGYGAFNFCFSLTSFIISSDNENYSADGGILYNKDKSTLIAYPSAVGDIKIADSVQTIGDSAFAYCDLTSVEMPNVETIDKWAFINCDSLTSVEMYSVHTIGERAFFWSDFLTSAYFYSDAPTSFGGGVFTGCHEDFTIYYAKGTQGWTTPEWNGYPAYPFDVVVTGVALDKTETELEIGETVQLTATVTPESATNKNVTWTSSDESIATVDENGLVTAISAGTVIITVRTEDGGYTATCEVTVSESNVYTVTFKDWDGTVLATDEVEHGESAEAPTAPTREGYTFTGWDKDFTNVTADMTVTAQYEINTYTVTFVDHDGTVIDTQEVEHGESAEAPENPTREGYTFTGWDKDFTNVTADMTVTAQYAINTYTVIFTDGVTGETISTATVQHGSDVAFPEPPAHDGYTFTGWDSDGKNITADTTITAQYEAISTGVHGDLTGDGTVNTADAVSLLKLAAGMIELTPEQEAVADVNRDGKVNTADAVMILKYAAGLIDEL